MLSWGTRSKSLHMDSFHNLRISGNRGERPSSSRPGERLSYELFKAAASGNLEELKRLLKKLEVKDGLAETIANLKHEYDGESLLHAAASGEDAINVCKYLVEEVKLDVNTESEKSGETPLHVAIQSRHYHTVVYLLQNGANPNAISKEGITPLHFAVSTSQGSKITKLLISKGADPNKETSCGSPLLVAAAFGNNDCVEALLDSHADPNVIDADTVSPLLASIEAKSIECVNLLLKGGADPNLCHPMGFSPLTYAAVKGFTEIIKCLWTAGADPDAYDNLTGAKPVEAAALHHNHEALIILLPWTTPTPNISDWSSDGIMEHVFSVEGQAERKCRAKVDISFLKSKGEVCIKEKDYIGAVFLYTQVLVAYPTDVEALSIRMICFFQMEDGEEALKDALNCIRLRPGWPKAYRWAGAAFMLLKKFKAAADAFYHGWKLDPMDKELEHSFWDAMKALSDAS